MSRFTLSSICKNGLLIVFGLIASLIVLEGAVRFLQIRKPPADAIVYQRSPLAGVLYEFKPNLRQVLTTGELLVTSSSGLRAHSDYEKGTHDAVFLGDSVTAAVNLDPNEAFPAVVERTIAGALPYKVRALNFGVNGYSTSEEAAVLAEKAIHYKPRYVFINYVLNDPVISESPYRALYPPESSDRCFIPFSAQEIPCVMKRIAKHLEGIKFLFTLLRTAQTTMTYEYERDYYADIHQDSEAFARVESAFASIAHTCSQEIHCDVFLVLFPLIKFNQDSYQWSEVHQKVATAAKKQGFHIIDLLPTLRKYRDEELKASQNDILHYNKFGHDIIGRTIGEKFLEYLRVKGEEVN